MPPIPFREARSFYQNALVSSGQINTPEEYWTSGSQPLPNYNTKSNFLSFGAGVGFLSLLGTKAIGNKRIFDYYVGAARAIEEISPAFILRTFQLSHIMSPLETASRQYRYFSPEMIRTMRKPGQELFGFAQHLEKLTGVSMTNARLMESGFRFEGGKLLYGKTGQDILLGHAGIIRSPGTAAARYQEAYARSLAGRQVPGITRALESKIPYLSATGEELSERFFITGGKSRLSAYGRSLAGLGTSFVDRINRLAQAPIEWGPIDKIKKIPGLRLGLGVAPSSGLKTFGKLAAKLGLGLPAAYLGYQQLDYYIREASIFDNTLLSEGITAAGATIWTKANLLASHIAEATGLHSYREEQERIASGSTSLSTLAGFPLLGMFAGATAGFAGRLNQQRLFMKAGLSLSEASSAVQLLPKAFTERMESRPLAGLTSDQKILALLEEQTSRMEAGWRGKAAKWLGKRQQSGFTSSLFRRLGSPSKGLHWKAGGVLGLAAILPFIPGALVPSDRPEELEKIYSGEKEIPLRAGRWWEMGRSPWEGGRIKYYRKHWYPRLLARSTERSIWGDESPSPISQWLQENFTYNVEQAHYWDRPYPETGAAFSSIPFIGPLLSATVGQFVKPTKLMHEEEWQRKGGEEVLGPYPGYGQTIPQEGELGPGVPISPSSLKGILGSQAYRLQEMIGLPGFVLASIKEKLTGTPELFDKEMRLASAGDIYGNRSYWDEEIGGGIGTCFVPGSLIKTVNGLVEIENINIEDKVLSQGCYRPVKAILKRKPTSPIINIQTRGLGVKLTCTDNHWIPVLRRCQYSKGHVKPFEEKNISIIEVQAKDIEIGDYLFYEIDSYSKDYVIDLYEVGKTFTDKFVYFASSLEWARAYEALEALPEVNRSARKYLRSLGFSDAIAKEVIYQFRNNHIPSRNPRFIPVTDDIAYVIGWYIAEGSTDGTHLNFTMHADEAEYANRIFNIFRNLGYKGLLQVEDNTLRLSIYSTALSRYFKRFGIKAQNKHIPYEFQSLPLDKLKQLIEGLLLGDGWDGKEWKGGFTSTSRKLVKDLANCLLKLGKFVYLNLDYLEKAKGLYPQGTPRKDCLRHYLTFRQGRQAWRFYKTSFLTPVSSIEYIEDQSSYVYDLEIEDIHYYTVDNILVHNTELLRRLIPHKQNQIPEYNPLRNTMPSWLPGPGDKSPDFLHGDPFTTIPLGETRLPGIGYAALHPQVEGIDPEDYPLIERFKILGDVAPYSQKFEKHLIAVRAAIKNRTLTDRDKDIYKRVMEQVQSRKQKREFTPYKYKDRQWTDAKEKLIEANEAAKEEPKDSWFDRTVGRYWETISHNAETPLEFLTPISPASKLIHARTAVEDYERNQVFGTEQAFWQKPWSNFLKPFLDSSAHSIGWNNIPQHVQQRRDLEHYFDILKYVKFTRLKRTAQAASDETAAKEFENKRRETLFGINPYTFNFGHLYRSLPRRERDYFNEFVAADLEERAQIMQQIPENEKALYLARWQIQDAQDMQKAIDQGLLDNEEVAKAQEQIAQMYEASHSEGFPNSKELWAEYLATRMKEESYPDWYRRTYLIEKELEDLGMSLPGPDWVGFQPNLNLDDIKLKIVEQLGESPYDYDIWPDQVRAAARRPILAEATQELEDALQLNNHDIQKQAKDVLSSYDISDYHITVTPTVGFDRQQIKYFIQEDRSEELRKVLKGLN